jgi:hypothetical protein
MYRKEDIIKRLNELNFNKDLYWITTGAAMVLYGIKEFTSDIDLGCDSKLISILESTGIKATILSDNTKRIKIEPDVEIFENWGSGDTRFIDSHPVLSPESIIKIKQELGREKDIKDIKLLEEYLANNKE